MNKDHYQILILGGGTAGITVAAQLRRKLKTYDLAIIEIRTFGNARESDDSLRYDSRDFANEFTRYNQIKHARQCCGLGGCRQIHIAAPEVFECLSDR